MLPPCCSVVDMTAVLYELTWKLLWILTLLMWQELEGLQMQPCCSVMDMTAVLYQLTRKLLWILTLLMWQELEGLQMQEQPGGQLDLLLDPIKPDWQVRAALH